VSTGYIFTTNGSYTHLEKSTVLQIVVNFAKFD